MSKENTEIYKDVVDACKNIDLKGKNMLYTSDNGHMFSQINKVGEIGFRFSETRKKELLEKLNTSDYLSYGKKMSGYILIPENLLSNTEKLVSLLKESHQYVLSLEPK